MLTFSEDLVASRGFVSGGGGGGTARASCGKILFSNIVVLLHVDLRVLTKSVRVFLSQGKSYEFTRW